MSVWFLILIAAFSLQEDDELNSANTQFMTQAEKRAHHNALERKRRDHIKDSFHSLRDSVPNLNGEKASRAMILKQATDYIQFMTKKNSSIQSDIDDLKRQTIVLEQQVKGLEKAKSTGQFALNSTYLHDSPTFESGSNLGLESDSDSSNSEPVTGSKRKRIKTSAS